MSRVVRVQDGNYKIVVGSSLTPGDIILDTHPAGEFGPQGKVLITGDLEVLGNTVVVESQTFTVSDNIIVLNQGESNAGVGLLVTTSGVQIDRGTENDVSILWDENYLSRDRDFGTDIPGTFVFTDSSNNLKSIAVAGIDTGGGDLSLISSGTGILTVSGTVDYEQQIIDYTKLNVVFAITQIERAANIAIIVVDQPHNLSNGDQVSVICLPDPSFTASFVNVTVETPTSFSYSNAGSNIAPTPFVSGLGGTVQPNPLIDDDSIPNLRAVADLVSATSSAYISDRIQENDTTVQVSDIDTSGVSEITFTVNGAQRGVFSDTGLTVDNINIAGNTISNIPTDNVRFNSVISLQHKAPSDPLTLSTSGYITVYSEEQPGTGGTGIYFVDNLGTSDELISKTKALLYSLIL